MVDVAMEGMRPVENSIKKYFKTEVFDEVDTLGKKFLFQDQSKDKNLGDWQVKRAWANEKDPKSNKNIILNKRKEEQNLTISYSHDKMTGLDFTLSDGETIVSLQKNKDEKLVVSRKDKFGKSLPGSEDLSPKEYVELSNFPVKFWIDRNVNAIVDTVDPSKVIRYVLPVGATAFTLAGIGAQASMRDMSTYTDNQLRKELNRPVSIQKVDNVVLKSPAANDYSPVSGIKEIEFPENLILLDPPKDRQDFYDAAINFIKNNGDLSNLSSIEELKLIDRLLTSGNNVLTEAKVREYFEAKNSNGIYHYRADSRGGDPMLVKPLEDALKILQKDPTSQRSIFALFDGLHSYNTAERQAQSLITPEKVMNQMSYSGPTENISAQQIWESFWNTGANNYNQGSIKGFNLNLSTSEPSSGDLFVYPGEDGKGVVGMIMSTDITKNEAGDVVKGTVLVWTYDQTTGDVKIIKYNKDNFPNGKAIGFRK